MSQWLQLAIALLLTNCLSWGAALKTSAASTLPDTVQVVGEAIFLSDLLPPGAAPELREIAKTVDFGRSPLPGSLRALGRAEILRRLSRQRISLADMKIPEKIVVYRAAPSLDRETVRVAVAAFLRQREWQEAEMPTSAMLEWSGTWAEPPAPASLQVDAADWDAAQQALQFRVRCADQSQRGSFLVRAIPTAALQEVWRSRFSSPELSRPASPRVASRQSAASPEPALAQPGESAILLLERAGIRISMPVVCLERGVRQQQIRVREQQGHRVFRAEVVGVGRLRAAF